MRQYRFCGNFVAVKSTDNFKLRNHFLEAGGSTDQSEIEIRRIIDDNRLETTVPKAG